MIPGKHGTVLSLGTPDGPQNVARLAYILHAFSSQACPGPSLAGLLLEGS